MCPSTPISLCLTRNSIVIIIAIMIMMVKMILIIAVIIIINSPFQPGDFSTGSTTVYHRSNESV